MHGLAGGEARRKRAREVRGLAVALATAILARQQFLPAIRRNAVDEELSPGGVGGEVWGSVGKARDTKLQAILRLRCHVDRLQAQTEGPGGRIHLLGELYVGIVGPEPRDGSCWLELRRVGLDPLRART